ncbi:MAG: response regulator [Christensenellales bacterium]|uniref:Stage 0 sporulation protein A homolog n=1 Tax=Candidatus Avichristensenella intestinipullorum TaxID=2840693 RepID=A0A9D0YZ28_9FIRM|nr:response regulator [Christensenellales bacterium]HIQ63448.1 response regulator [Candidatus Avichristensenella intestinipullorum]
MSHSKPTVLIVEDEGYIRRVLEAVLHAGGYRVLSVQNGAAARAGISAYMPDLLLLDLGLPDMDGIALLKELRGWSRLPVIVVSARSTERDKILALDCGADDYITKPFSSPELLARMRAVLRRNAAAASPEDVYCVGDFKIDFVKRIVTVGGEPVRLTQVEYRIVELIARQPGNVLTYRQIIHHVWGPYADVDNNRILRVNMSNIRRKIERDSMSPQYILTEIGVGYRMAEKA